MKRHFPMGTPKMICMLLLALVAGSNIAEATWCVVRSGASAGALQAGLNYACSHGADCGPIQPGGSCFNPNTIQNHASYAYDSYYQRNGKAPTACNFGGTATIAVSDPSFGSCRYPPIESIGRAEDATKTKSLTGDSTN